MKQESGAMTDHTREKPLVRSRIGALLTKANSCETGPSEAAAALATARELADRYDFAPDDFRWPVTANIDCELEAPTNATDLVPEPPKAARGRGIGMLARQLIIDRRGWTYAQIASEVNARIDGARSTAQSVRWYSNAMRREGRIGALAKRVGTGDQRNGYDPP
jgi:hypothetical protein